MTPTYQTTDDTAIVAPSTAAETSVKSLRDAASQCVDANQKLIAHLPPTSYLAYTPVPKPNGKLDKVPFQARSNNPKTWLTAEDALQNIGKVGRERDDEGYWQYLPVPVSGLAFIVREGIITIDIDDCIDAKGKLSAGAEDMLRLLGSFAYKTVSGKGIRIVGLNACSEPIPGDKTWVHNILGIETIEIFVGPCNFFNTMSADILPGYDIDLVDISWMVRQWLATEAEAEDGQCGATDAGRGIREERSIEDIRAALENIKNDDKVGWDDWSRIGAAVFSASGGSSEGLAAFRDWTATKAGEDLSGCDARWSAWQTAPYTDVNFGTLRYEARKADPTFDTRNGAPEAEDEFEALEEMPDASPIKARAFPLRKTLRDRLVFPSQCAEADARRGYLIKGLLAPQDVAALVGHPGTGKSVLAPYLAYAIAQGRSVFGMRVKAGKVLYAVAEDYAGMKQRVDALCRKFTDAPDLALVDLENLNVKTNEQELVDFAEDWQPSLVVIDTLGAAWSGIDENSSQAMGVVVAAARRIAVQGPAVLLIHHIAKNGDGSPRGHSILNGTLDACLSLAPVDDNGIVRVKMSKNRNGPCDLDMAFRIEAAELGEDEDGDMVTAPIAKEVSVKVAKPLPQAEQNLSGNNKLAMLALQECLTRSGVVQMFGDQTCTIEEWRQAFYSKQGDAKINTKWQAFNRASVKLQTAGVIEVRDPLVWLKARIDNPIDEFNAMDGPAPGEIEAFVAV